MTPFTLACCANYATFVRLCAQKASVSRMPFELSAHKKDPAISEVHTCSIFCVTGRLKPVVPIRANPFRFFLRQKTQIIAFDRRERSMTNIFLHPIN